MSGAFQTSRDIFSNPIWKNIVEFRLFFLIYGNAVFSDEGVRLADDLILKRGEWCRSTRKIQEDLTYIENRQVKTYSTSVINRCIKKLEQSQRICTRTHELGTVFTVVNYEQYQGFGGFKNSNLERNLEQSGNSGRTVEEQSGNNNKNVKKDKNDKKELKDIIPFSEIIDFLNLKASTNYKSSSKVTQRHIAARWNDGFRMEHFHSVIEKKCAEWIGTEMEQYLRPETLFGTKFEAYLNQKTVIKGGVRNAQHGRSTPGYQKPYSSDSDPFAGNYEGSPDLQLPEVSGYRNG